jgi:hypothetical protein
MSEPLNSMDQINHWLNARDSHLAGNWHDTKACGFNHANRHPATEVTAHEDQD